jgi:hypothetical protein
MTRLVDKTEVMDPQAITEPTRPTRTNPSRWRLGAAIVGSSITGFFIAFELGLIHIDRTQSTSPPTMMWALFLFSLYWLIKAGVKWPLRPGRRALSFFMGTAALATLGYAGFHFGEEAAYPSDTKRVLRDIHAHLKQLKSSELEISSERQADRNPASLLRLESEIDKASDEASQVEDLLDKASLMSKPDYIAEVLDLVRKGLSLDKWEHDNLRKQITILKSMQKANGVSRATSYHQQLVPLLAEEERIKGEQRALASDVPSQVRQIMAKAGFDASVGDRVAAIAASGLQAGQYSASPLDTNTGVAGH